MLYVKKHAISAVFKVNLIKGDIKWMTSAVSSNRSFFSSSAFLAASLYSCKSAMYVLGSYQCGHLNNSARIYETKKYLHNVSPVFWREPVWPS